MASKPVSAHHKYQLLKYLRVQRLHWFHHKIKNPKVTTISPCPIPIRYGRKVCLPHPWSRGHFPVWAPSLPAGVVPYEIRIRINSIRRTKRNGYLQQIVRVRVSVHLTTNISMCVFSVSFLCVFFFLIYF